MINNQVRIPERYGKLPRNGAGSTGRCNTTGINLSSKGGVHVARETMEAFCRPAGRSVEPLESWAVITCDWSSAGQGPCGHSASVGASWGESLRLLVAVRGGYSPWPNAKTSPTE